MLDGVNLLCFVASYSVALALEASRLAFRAPVRPIVRVLFVAAGGLAHVLYLTNRFLAELPGGAPLSSWYDWCLLAALVLAVLYLVESLRRPDTNLGVFALPMVLGVIGLAALFQGKPDFPRKQAEYSWGLIHGGAMLAGAVIVAWGFLAGMLYLLQASRLKHKLPPVRGLRLPTLEWLQAVNRHSLWFSSVLLLAGLLAGVILNVIRGVRNDGSVPWTDPVVAASGVLFAWLLVVLVFEFVYRPARQGQKVAYLTLASFVVLCLVLTTVWFSNSPHAQGAEAGAAADAERVSRRLPAPEEPRP